MCYVAGDNDEDLDKTVTNRILKEAIHHAKRAKHQQVPMTASGIEITDEKALKEVQTMMTNSHEKKIMQAAAQLDTIEMGSRAQYLLQAYFIASRKLRHASQYVSF